MIFEKADLLSRYRHFQTIKVIKISFEDFCIPPLVSLSLSLARRVNGECFLTSRAENDEMNGISHSQQRQKLSTENILSSLERKIAFLAFNNNFLCSNNMCNCGKWIRRFCGRKKHKIANLTSK
jgi:hypothetical protein